MIFMKNEGGFNLRKFNSNSKELEKLVFEKYPEDELYSVHQIIKVLGTTWDKSSDVIIYDLNEIRGKFYDNPTKRTVIQSFASIFDPLGLISPITVEMKILFQDISVAKFKWDDELSVEFKKRWKQILINLEEVDKILVPRKYCFYNINDPVVLVQSHTFSDASKRMCASNMYLRFQFQSGLVKCVLVVAKSKILSIKGNITIPRSELNGVVLMCEICPAVINSLISVYNVNESFYWTDSSIVYAWVINKHKTYNNYVQKRLLKIREVINDNVKWNLIPSKLNPADIGTRGLMPGELKNSNLWFSGPDFLLFSTDSWPKLEIGDKFSSYESVELNKTNDTRLSNVTGCNTNLVTSQIIDACLSRVIDISRFSFLNKLLRVTAYVLKFVLKLKKIILKKKEDSNNSKDKNNTRETNYNTKEIISSDEILQAKTMWIKTVQKDVKSYKHFNDLKKELNLFEDEKSLLRCGGRLGNADIPYNVEFPCILPKEHYFTKLVVLNSHNKEVKHNGVKDTLNYMRSEFWITNSRNYVKKILRECVLCRRFEGKSYSYPEPGPLPEARVNYGHAFNNIGIDYAGPVYVKNVYCVNNDSTMFKAWILIITCASSRGLYLDLVPDCSGKSCVEALIRFINSRGTPSLTISDNGKNFISQEVQDFASSKGMKWKFNIENAPWMGGFFERMVRSVKRPLRKNSIKRSFKLC